MKTLNQIFMLLAGTCGALLAPHAAQAQVNTVNMTVVSTPSVDSVSYDCETGDVQVHVPNAGGNLEYSVVSIMTNDGPSTNVPGPNTTGAFNLTGATEATFQVEHDGCFVEYIIAFDCGDRPLPLSFLTFDARLYKKNKGFLEWEVATEDDVDHYIVEKSADGSQFIEIAEVASAGEAGVITRNYIDENLYIGNNYYRIKQILTDGREVFSEIRTLPYYNESQPLVNIYPNPAVHHIIFDCTVDEDQTVILWVMDNVSRVVVAQTRYDLKAGNNKIELRLDGKADGTYIVGYKLQTEPEPRFLKFVKQVF